MKFLAPLDLVSHGTRRSSSLQEGFMKVIFLGGKQAGCVGLLTVLALGHKVVMVVAYDGLVWDIASELGIPVFTSIEQMVGSNDWREVVPYPNLLVSAHCREIVPPFLLRLPRLGGINVHPCLYRYKGPNPVGRLLRDGGTQASVGVHRMTEKVDEGEVLVEEFIDVTGKSSVEEIYNALYPFYALALIKALRILET